MLASYRRARCGAQYERAFRFVVHGPASRNVHLGTAQLEAVMDAPRSRLPPSRSCRRTEKQQGSRSALSAKAEVPDRSKQLTSRAAPIGEPLGRLPGVRPAGAFHGIEGDAAKAIGETEDAIDPRRDSVITYQLQSATEDAELRIGSSGSRKLGQP